MTHPIIPPPELVQQWVSDYASHRPELSEQVYVATRAAQWGADQELEACIEWLTDVGDLKTELRAARRPKPLSLKEQALGALGRFNSNTHTTADGMASDFELIRRALEQLEE